MTTAQQITLNFDVAATAQSVNFPINIKRSPRRRTIEIIVRDGGVDLMLPQFVSNAEGLSFVESKTAWIEKSLARQALHELEKRAREKRYVEGEIFQFLGRSYPLQIYLGEKAGRLVNNQLLVGIKSRRGMVKADAVKKQVWAWYQQQAKDILTEKTLALANTIGRACSGVKLRRTKTKWGHCTREGEIQYNWQIITAPEPVVDYLVVHEVSHLLHHNHSKRFWRQVEKMCPDYREHEQWLKVHGYKIEF